MGEPAEAARRRSLSGETRCLPGARAPHQQGAAAGRLSRPRLQPTPLLADTARTSKATLRVSNRLVRASVLPAWFRRGVAVTSVPRAMRGWRRRGQDARAATDAGRGRWSRAVPDAPRAAVLTDRSAVRSVALVANRRCEATRASRLGFVLARASDPRRRARLCPTLVARGGAVGVKPVAALRSERQRRRRPRRLSWRAWNGSSSG